MQDLAKLSDLAAAEIELLQADGIELSPADIVRLNALGWAVESPETRRLLARGAPVAVGGATLWPLSLYAQEWYDRVGCEMGGLRRQTYALGYAMAHGRDDWDPLSMSGRMAELVVLAWGWSLKCTFGELNVALGQILAQEEDHEQPPSETGGMAAGDFSAFLAASAGGDPDFWERRCAAGYTYAVLDAMVRQNSADGHKTLADPRIKASRASGWAAEQIRKARRLAGQEAQGVCLSDEDKEFLEAYRAKWG